MKSIKQALTERFYTWEDARQLAEEDPEIDLANATNPYSPNTYLEEDVAGADAAEQQRQQVEESAQGQIDPSTLPKTPESHPAART